MIAFLRRLLGFVKPYRNRLILGILSGVLYGLANTALLVVVKVVIDLVFPVAGAPTLTEQLQKAPAFLRRLVEYLEPLLPQLKSPKTSIGIGLVVSTIPAMMLLRGLCAYLNFYLLNWVAVRAIMDLRTKLFGHLQNLSLSFFHTSSTGDLISRISNDTATLHKIISNTFPVMVRSPIAVLGLVILLFTQQPKLTLVSLAVIPICVVPIVVYGRKVRKSSQAIQNNFAELTNLMQEAFTGARIVKAYNLEQIMLDRFRASSRVFTSLFMRIIRSLEIPGVLIEFMGSIGIALVLLYVALVDRKSPGDFFQFVLSIIALYQPIKELSRLPGQLQQARASSQRVFELLDTQSTIEEPRQPLLFRADKTDIQFDGIDFAYGDKPALRNIHLTVRAGQLVALVGSSGSGKTTLANLLLRFYDPQQGAVRINGTDIRQFATRDLRNHIAVVTQEIILFNETVRQNIALGRPGATHAEIEEAARHAHAHEFILEKPRGYDTVIGEKGVNLSGGQRQRIAIARAILKQAPILILDEATSALDTESERAVQAALEELMQGRTTICIAHRLSTIQSADLIVVMDQGRIVETGKHAELITKNGIYQKLYELQFQS